ncbi:hypothetical protein BPT24_026 [Tenacibaculum phage pT24]|uniref:Uncharacterized protein n=1 Tax=Tenacibaculum phage pT24 TaxID=1880590 RepID=A0A1B4XWF2_9CAUD|nr:hypothetical protein HYP10_gp026 [Tenacibaculum phage pT24]BAV39148.1 hypothetical protein BPT24_026 [Tenacibaculum phage pT24]
MLNGLDINQIKTNSELVQIGLNNLFNEFRHLRIGKVRHDNKKVFNHIEYLDENFEITLIEKAPHSLFFKAEGNKVANKKGGGIYKFRLSYTDGSITGNYYFNLSAKS